MSDRVVVFVDAGFLLATGGQLVTGNSLRSAYSVDFSGLLSGIEQTVRQHSGAPILRIYWYDASKDALPGEEHKRLGMMNGVKVRLGRLSYNGEQKGVDMKLALDLVGLARNRAATTAYILSGDDDLAEAVEEAQDLGMRAVLLGIANSSARLGVVSVAEHLALCADEILALPHDLVEHFFIKRQTVAPTPRDVLAPRTIPPITRPQPIVTASAREHTPSSELVDEKLYLIAEEIGESLAANYYNTTTQSDLAQLLSDKPILPQELDRILLKDCAARIGENNTNRASIRHKLRDSFWQKLGTFG